MKNPLLYFAIALIPVSYMEMRVFFDLDRNL